MKREAEDSPETLVPVGQKHDITTQNVIILRVTMCLKYNCNKSTDEMQQFLKFIT